MGTLATRIVTSEGASQHRPAIIRPCRRRAESNFGWHQHLWNVAKAVLRRLSEVLAVDKSYTCEPKEKRESDTRSADITLIITQRPGLGAPKLRDLHELGKANVNYGV